MIAHIFDIDVLLTTDAKPWIVNKRMPNEPLIKLEKSDFNLIKNGVYKNQGNKIEYNDKVYWLPNNLFGKLKIIAKNKKMSLDDMAISMQEFLNKTIIEKSKFDINLDSILPLKNKNEDIYLVCATNSKNNSKLLIEKLIGKLNEEGILIKKFYYINDTFYNVNTDEIVYKKSLICLKHLVGYEIKENKFIDEELTKYSKLYFYDDAFDTLKIPDEINSFLKYVLHNTDSGLKEAIKENIKDNRAVFIANKIASNKYNKSTNNEVKISLSNIKTFENFKYKG